MEKENSTLHTPEPGEPLGNLPLEAQPSTTQGAGQDTTLESMLPTPPLAPEITPVPAERVSRVGKTVGAVATRGEFSGFGKINLRSFNVAGDPYATPSEYRPQLANQVRTLPYDGRGHFVVGRPGGGYVRFNS